MACHFGYDAQAKNDIHLGSQIRHDERRDEAGNGAHGAGDALQDAGILRSQIDVTQEESAHNGQFTCSLTQRQQEDGDVSPLIRQLTDCKDADGRYQKTDCVEDFTSDGQRVKLFTPAPVEEFAYHQVSDQSRSVRHR